MSESNPYSPPASDVKEPLPELGELSAPRKLPGGRGWGWVTEGYDYFKESPGTWVLMMLVFILIMMGLSLIPIVSIITNLLTPIFLGGMMLACRTSDEGGEIKFAHLFAGFQTNAGKLAAVGGFYLLGGIAITAVVFVIIMLSGGIDAAISSANTEHGFNPIALGIGGIVAILVALMLSVPLMMAFWFAPPLAVLHGLPAFQAMLLSFHGCVKNMMPFLLYGVVIMLLGILAAIPIFLGYLVLSPVIIASIYVAYKDIFLEKGEDEVQRNVEHKKAGTDH